MSITKSTIIRNVSVPGSSILLDDGPIVPNRNYTVFRGMSPTSASRIENRIKELEDALEAEREIHLRSERELAEVNAQLMSLTEKVDETESQLVVEIDQNRKKDQEIAKLKKDLELNKISQETELSNLKKRHNELIQELNEQLEKANKHKNRSEKDRHQINIEIDSLNTTLDNANKARSFAESKLEAAEDQIRRLKSQLDDLNRTVGDLKNGKEKLGQENQDLHKQLRDFELNNGNFSKVRTQLQVELDDIKNQYDDQNRAYTNLEVQLGNLQLDFEKLQSQLDEEVEEGNSLRAQNQKLSNDYSYLKSKYDKDILGKGEELEDLKRKLNTKIQELENQLEQARGKHHKLEKDKSKLTMEIRDMQAQLDEANAFAADATKRAKQFEHALNEWQKKFSDLSDQYNVAKGDADRSAQEVARMKPIIDDQSSKIDQLMREIKKLQDALKESESNNKELNRDLQDNLSIKLNFQNERDNLMAELGDARDLIRDLEGRLDSTNSQLNSLKADYDTKLRERDDEIENQRRNGLRNADELQKTIVEIETRLKGDHGRLKKKHENELNEYIMQIDGLNHAHNDLIKNNKNLGNRIRELEVLVEDERHAGDQARDSLGVLERKVISLTSENDDLRAQLEAAERARKNAENELSESSSSSQQINITISNLNNDKKRLEGDLIALQREYEDVLSNFRVSDTKIDSLNHEISRLNDQLRGEQDRTNQAEVARKQLEVQIHELNLRLEEADHSREGKKAAERLKNRIHELESELDLEQRRSRDISNEIRKYQKQAHDYKTQYEDEHRLNNDLKDQNHSLLNKLALLNKQIEEQDEVLSITMNKYRKVQQELEDAERRADRVAENNVSAIRHATTAVGLGAVPMGVSPVSRVPGGFRSVSVSRNIKY